MPAVWRLVISSLASRPVRSLLLALAVALATALVVCTGSVLGTLKASIDRLLGRIAGLAEVRLSDQFQRPMPGALVEQLQDLPEVRLASPTLRLSAALEPVNPPSPEERQRRQEQGRQFPHTGGGLFGRPAQGQSQGQGGEGSGGGLIGQLLGGAGPSYRVGNVEVLGVDPSTEPRIRPRDFLAGRMIEKTGEVALDGALANRLTVRVGEKVRLDTGWEPQADQPKLEVVGIYDRPTLTVLQAPRCLVPMDQARRWFRQPKDASVKNPVHRIDLMLAESADPESFVEAHRGDFQQRGRRLEVLGSGQQNVRRGRLALNLVMLVTTAVVHLSAAFIILTGMTTAVTQQSRELGMLRCLGLHRWQIGAIQLSSGLAIAGLGCLIGTPLGLALAWRLYARFAESLEAGFHVNLGGIGLAVGGALAAGLIGALYPAWAASRVNPMQALTQGAKPTDHRLVWVCLGLGLLLVLIDPLVLLMPLAHQGVFWTHVLVGIPGMLIGLFLLSVPALVVLAKLLGGPLSLLLALPRELLSQSLLATPVRHGFTGGALMIGLGLLVGIWTNGRSALSNWFERIEMPDAFVQRYNSIPPDQLEQIRDVPGVKSLCPTTAFPVNVKDVSFGVKGIGIDQALYVSSDMDAFFEMADLNWVAGDRVSALRKFRRGRALLVSKEYQVAHGVGLGDTLTLATTQGPVDFEVVGIVGATGLDIAVQYFGIGDPYRQAAVTAVFGTRDDAAKYFGVRATNLVLLKLTQEASDEAVVRRLQEKMPQAHVGSSRQIKDLVRAAANELMGVASTIAVVSLLIACFGVGNLIAASIAARQYEYGVLRAIGTPPGLLGRLVLAQTLVVAAVGSVCGLGFGWLLVISDQAVRRQVLGLEYGISPQWSIQAMGVGLVVLAATLSAAGPIIRLVRTPARVLLASRGA